MNRFAAACLSIVLLALTLATTRAADAPVRAPAPDSATQATAMKLLGQVYKEDISKAHTPAEKAALAAKMIDLAKGTKGAEQFALYTKAAEIAAGAGDVNAAMSAVDRLCEQFDVDEPGLRADMLGKIGAALHMNMDHLPFYRRCDAVLDVAVRQEKMDAAKKVSDLIVAVARKSGDAGALKWATSRAGEIRAERSAFERQKGVLATLEKNPADPEANLSAGKYRCFITEDWAGGLPLLAKGADAALKNAATLELAAGSDPKAKVPAADAWWDHAAKEQGATRKRVQEHAVGLYQEAIASLNGLARSRVEKRIATLAESDAAGSWLSGHPMSPSEVIARFTFPNNTFQLKGDVITGTAESVDNADKYVWLTNAETLPAFEYGLAMKATAYQLIAFEIDGHRYFYSRGHWANGGGQLQGGKSKAHLEDDGKIKKPDDWAYLKVQVAQETAKFYYNGALAGTCDLVTPMSKSSQVKVAFGTHQRPISVKDVYLLPK